MDFVYEYVIEVAGALAVATVVWLAMRQGVPEQPAAATKASKKKKKKPARAAQSPSAGVAEEAADAKIQLAAIPSPGAKDVPELAPANTAGKSKKAKKAAKKTAASVDPAPAAPVVSAPAVAEPSTPAVAPVDPIADPGEGAATDTDSDSDSDSDAETAADDYAANAARVTAPTGPLRTLRITPRVMPERQYVRREPVTGPTKKQRQNQEKRARAREETEAREQERRDRLHAHRVEQSRTVKPARPPPVGTSGYARVAAPGQGPPGLSLDRQGSQGAAGRPAPERTPPPSVAAPGTSAPAAAGASAAAPAASARAASPAAPADTDSSGWQTVTSRGLVWD
ncbi:uncharacterized protein V1510DRAFT_163415 [Dipodascopsis tothii]|uniref:uncharacterized protein n=1 Tax=Dipodascopsis tothii TaxID=44089 RepID=UPI0034CEA5D6